MSEFPSGNPARDGALVMVIREAIERGDVLTAANVSLLCSQQFGDSFSDVSENELAECVAFLGSATAELGSATAEVEQPEPPAIPREVANENARMAFENLERARRDLMAAQTVQRAARTTLAQCVLAWGRGGAPPMTREQLMRQEIAANQAQKQALKGGTASPRPMRQPGPSVIDRQAFYSAQGDANDFARARLQTGRHRGSVSLKDLAHMRARAARAKVPSER